MANHPEILPSALGATPGSNGQSWEGLLGVLQAFHRWQQSPADHLRQDFFQWPAQGLCALQREYPPHRQLLLQRAVLACLPGWRQVFATGFGSHSPREATLIHRVVPSGPGTWGVAMAGYLAFEGAEGARLMVRIELEPRMPNLYVVTLMLFAPTDQAPVLRVLLDRMDAWMAANPHLRGAKLDAQGDLLHLDRTYTWEDIVLEPDTRAAIDRHIVQFVHRLPRYQAFGVPPKRGVLLVGPPGTGKTLLGKVLCCLLPTTFLWVSPGVITTPEALQHLFALARECQPTILFLEDLDCYASRRGGGGNPALLGELLNQLDGFPDNTGLLTLATTNEPRAIEPALADRPSRFDQVIRMDPPKAAGREALLHRFLRAFPHVPEDLAEIVTATDGLTGAHLQEVVHLAIQRALDSQETDDTAPPKVTLEDLREAVRFVRKSRGASVGHYA